MALRRPWPKAEKIIADYIGTTPQAIWPSRYNEDGSPKSGHGIRRYSTQHNVGRRAA
jgi:Ner family transcriptional regulator